MPDKTSLRTGFEHRGKSLDIVVVEILVDEVHQHRPAQFAAQVINLHGQRVVAGNLHLVLAKTAKNAQGVIAANLLQGVGGEGIDVTKGNDLVRVALKGLDNPFGAPASLPTPVQSPGSMGRITERPPP